MPGADYFSIRCFHDQQLNGRVERHFLKRRSIGGSSRGTGVFAVLSQLVLGQQRNNGRKVGTGCFSDFQYQCSEGFKSAAPRHLAPCQPRSARAPPRIFRLKFPIPQEQRCQVASIARTNSDTSFFMTLRRPWSQRPFIRLVLLITLTSSCVPAMTATPQLPSTNGRGRFGLAVHYQVHTPSFAAGRGEFAPRPSATNTEGDAAINSGSVIGASYGVSERLNLELDAYCVPPVSLNGGAIGVRVHAMHTPHLDVGIAGRFGVVSGSGGGYSDSYVEDDGTKIPTATVVHGSVTLVASTVQWKLRPLLAASVMPLYITRSVCLTANPNGYACTSEPMHKYGAAVYTATFALYGKLSNAVELGPFVAVSRFAMPAKQGGAATVLSYGLAFIGRRAPRVIRTP